jgi:hypothetical protein
MALNCTLICCRVGSELHLFALLKAQLCAACYAGLIVDGRIEGLGTTLPAQPLFNVLCTAGTWGEH